MAVRRSDWATWIVRTLLLVGIAYAGYWSRDVNDQLRGLTADVAYIKGKLDGIP